MVFSMDVQFKTWKGLYMKTPVRKFLVTLFAAGLVLLISGCAGPRPTVVMSKPKYFWRPPIIKGWIVCPVITKNPWNGTAKQTNRVMRKRRTVLGCYIPTAMGCLRIWRKGRNGSARASKEGISRPQTIWVCSSPKIRIIRKLSKCFK